MAAMRLLRCRSKIAALVAILACAVPQAAGQSQVESLVSPGSSSERVDPQEVVEAAVASFAATVAERLALENRRVGEPIDHAADIAEARRTEIGTEFIDDFQERLTRSVTQLQGDGLLYAREVSLDFEDIRESSLQELEELVAAIHRDIRPPPQHDDFDSDWDHVVALAQYTVLDRNPWHAWARLLASVLLGFALAAAVLKASKVTVDASDAPFQHSVRSTISSLHSPLYVLCAAGGLAAGLESVWLPPDFGEPAKTTIMVLIVIAAFWVLWRLSTAATRRVGEWAMPAGESPGQQVLEIVRKVLRLVLILVFIIIGAELLFDTDLTALAAGLGIIGLAVTLAAQDTLKDLFAAVTLHVNSPFGLGDLVRFGGYLGHVEEVGFRMSRLRTLDGHLVTIPNAKLVSDAVENLTARRSTRHRFRLDLPYDTPLDRVSEAVEITRDVIQSTGDIAEDSDVQVHFDELGAHSLRLLVQYYCNTSDYWQAKKIATDVDLALIERFRAADIDFAFPTQTLHLVGIDGDVSENGPPADDVPDDDPTPRAAD